VGKRRSVAKFLGGCKGRRGEEPPVSLSAEASGDAKMIRREVSRRREISALRGAAGKCLGGSE
jgi:hypothetical protein